ncbi:MAG: hypothetical protein R2715_25145 [Ilumatobacteraceae bacterium]
MPVTLLLPTLAATLGIDGGAIFQILAIENLGLSRQRSASPSGSAWRNRSRSRRTYLGRRARSNVQLFLSSLRRRRLLAALVGFGATDGIAATALVITVLAEISLSVLFATAWQPLLSHRVDSAVASGSGRRGRRSLVPPSPLCRPAVRQHLDTLAQPDPRCGRWGRCSPRRASPASNHQRRSTCRHHRPTGRSTTHPIHRIVLLVFAAVNVGASAALALVYLDRDALADRQPQGDRRRHADHRLDGRVAGLAPHGRRRHPPCPRRRRG